MKSWGGGTWFFICIARKSGLGRQSEKITNIPTIVKIIKVDVPSASIKSRSTKTLLKICSNTKIRDSIKNLIRRTKFCVLLNRRVKFYKSYDLFHPLFDLDAGTTRKRHLGSMVTVNRPKIVKFHKYTRLLKRSPIIVF